MKTIVLEEKNLYIQVKEDSPRNSIN
jgi:hypothetical protein